ncbi:MAG: F510_1955 family glycosylhydrolase [Solirubrobacteraceae bacterium]
MTASANRKQRAREQREERERQATRAERRKRLHTIGAGGLLAAVAIGALLATTLAGGDGDERIGGGGGGGVTGGGHIHGLGVNPADGSLYIATHGGLFRSAEGSSQAPRVGSSDRDLMGFSVVGRDRFVASGHPGSEPGLPPNIGLTESRDGGETWEPVSLTGEADFHVLRASGSRIYGYDGVNGRLMVSTNTGREWTERQVPSPLVDLAIDPRDADRVTATTESGLVQSRDAGRSWRKLSDQVALLAWPAGDRLVMLDGAGRVSVSADGGRTTQPQGAVQGQAVSFMASPDSLYVALSDGSVLESSDDGASFTVRAKV